MASVALLFFGLMFSVHTGNSDWLFDLKCESAVGVIGQTTNIPCSIESRYKPVIDTVVLKRLGEKKPCFEYQPYENTMTGDPRFKVLDNLSLQLQNTVISDEGEYEYYISTTVGWDAIIFTISVTGRSKFNQERNDHKEDHETEMSVTWTIIIVVVVIGCLIIILLVVLWFTRKYLHSLRKARSMELPWNFSKPADVDEKFALNEPVNPYQKQLMSEENVAVSRLIL